MYSWHNAGNVAARCLLCIFFGPLIGVFIWVSLNVIYLLLGMPVDAMFEYACNLYTEFYVYHKL
jgi:hypothetical protein